MTGAEITFANAFYSLPEPFLTRYQDAAFGACRALAEVAGRLSVSIPDDQLQEREADIIARAAALAGDWCRREEKAARAAPGTLKPTTDMEEWCATYTRCLAAMQQVLDSYAELQTTGGLPPTVH